MANMLIYLSLLICSANGLAISPKQAPTAGDYTINKLRLPRAISEPSPLKITENVINLKRVDVPSVSSSIVHKMLGETGVSRLANGNVSLLGVLGGGTFLAPITVGGQTFEVVVDSGSSDPWLVLSNFQCLDANTNAPLSQASCLFGPTYNPFLSTNFKNILTENFNISYADGESLSGAMGYDSMTMAGITVPQQQLGLVNSAAWQGDGYSSGVVGFAYSALTNAYLGTNPVNDVKGYAIHYNPFFSNAYLSNAISPVWSIAVSRDMNNPGVLALGGLPNVRHSPTFTSTPIQPMGINAAHGSVVYEHYTINVDGFGFSNSPTVQFQPGKASTSTSSIGSRSKTSLVVSGDSVIVDTGTTLVYLPNDIAASVAAAFTPPGRYDASSGVYFVDCNATPPTFVVGIGGKIFYANPLDMILQVSYTQCISGVQGNNGGLTILGNVWLKSVVAVFDVGAGLMRFAAQLS